MRGAGRLGLVLLCLAATTRGQTTPAPPPSATAILARAAALYGDGAAHASDFTQIYTPSGFTTARRESGTVWIQSPEKLRFDYLAPEKKVFTYDGVEGRFFSPEDKQLTVRKLSAEEKAKLPIVSLAKPEELVKRYEITREASGSLLLKPRATDADLAWLRLSIGEAGTLDSLSYEDASGNRTEFRFAEWREKKPRAVSDYRVTGPPGTRIVEN